MHRTIAALTIAAALTFGAAGPAQAYIEKIGPSAAAMPSPTVTTVEDVVEDEATPVPRPSLEATSSPEPEPTTEPEPEPTFTDGDTGVMPEGYTPEQQACWAELAGGGQYVETVEIDPCNLLDADYWTSDGPYDDGSDPEAEQASAYPTPSDE